MLSKFESLMTELARVTLLPVVSSINEFVIVETVTIEFATTDSSTLLFVINTLFAYESSIFGSNQVCETLY